MERTKQPQVYDELISAYTFAERKGVSNVAVYAKIKKGEIETVTVGKFNLIDWSKYEHIEFPFAQKIKGIKKTKTANASELSMIKLLANNKHKSLDPFEEALVINGLIAKQLSAADIARQTDNNRMQISNRLVLAKMTMLDKEFVKNKTISKTELVKLAKRVPDDKKRIKYLNKAASVSIDKPARLTADKIMKVNGDSTRSSKLRSKSNR